MIDPLRKDYHNNHNHNHKGPSLKSDLLLTKILSTYLHLFLQAGGYSIGQKAKGLLWELNFTIYKCISSAFVSQNVLVKGHFFHLSQY